LYAARGENRYTMQTLNETERNNIVGLDNDYLELMVLKPVPMMIVVKYWQ